MKELSNEEISKPVDLQKNELGENKNLSSDELGEVVDLNESVSFKAEYTKEEIDNLKNKLSNAAAEVKRCENAVHDLRHKQSLNDTKEKRANGDYARASAKLEEANQQLETVKRAKREAEIRLNNVI